MWYEHVRYNSLRATNPVHVSLRKRSSSISTQPCTGCPVMTVRSLQISHPFTRLRSYLPDSGAMGSFVVFYGHIVPCSSNKALPPLHSSPLLSSRASRFVLQPIVQDQNDDTHDKNFRRRRYSPSCVPSCLARDSRATGV